MSQATLTSARSMNSSRSLVPSAPGGATASVAPRARAPQISKVEASKASGAYCITRSPGSMPSPGWVTRFATASWVAATPLGVPVDPEV